MLDAGTKAQLKSYLDRITQPVEIVASLDDSKASIELQSLLKDVAEVLSGAIRGRASSPAPRTARAPRDPRSRPVI